MCRNIERIVFCASLNEAHFFILGENSMATCCFLGHRKMEETEELKKRLRNIIENLITKEKVDTFLFGSKSEFDSLCHRIVNEMKHSYPEIKRIYFSIYPPSIYDNPRPGAPVSYEEVYHPDGIQNAGKATYVKRNYEMIDHSDICVFYYNENYQVPTRRRNVHLPEPKRKSGTKVALDYAIKKQKKVINIFVDGGTTLLSR